jgi:hypothetical protein
VTPRCLRLAGTDPKRGAPGRAPRRPRASAGLRKRLSVKRMRNLVRETLARHQPEPPAEFVALQLSQLREALLVSYNAMGGGNLGAVDRVVKTVREMDRYHGFARREM